MGIIEIVYKMHKFISGRKVNKLWLGIKCLTAMDVLFCIYHFHRKTTYRLYLPKYQAFIYPPFSVQKSKSIDYNLKSRLFHIDP